MVVNGMFLKLNAMGYATQAYEDHIAIVIQGKYFSTVADLMQGRLGVIDDWWKIKGLSINHEKTGKVLLSRCDSNLSNEVKYLGVILDDKLMWKTCMRAQVKKGLKAP